MAYTAYLRRFLKSQFFTASRFLMYSDKGEKIFQCYVLELPFVRNERGISCIPVGSYSSVLHNSPKFGRVYKILDVPNRSEILIHKGNYLTDTKGCLLVGTAFNYSNELDKSYLSGSKAAFDKLMSFGITGFTLKITELC